jgi:hypothetical protein
MGVSCEIFQYVFCFKTDADTDANFFFSQFILDFILQVLFYLSFLNPLAKVCTSYSTRTGGFIKLSENLLKYPGDVRKANCSSHPA